MKPARAAIIAEAKSRYGIPQSAVPCDDSGLLTAREICLFCDLPRAEFERWKLRPDAMIQRSYGTVRGFSIDGLPAIMQRQLRKRMAALEVTTARDLIAALRADAVRKSAGERQSSEVESVSAAALEAAANRKLVIQVYYTELDNGKSQAQAAGTARLLWVDIAGVLVDERTLRRWIARVESLGGPEFAPDSAYTDRRRV